MQLRPRHSTPLTTPLTLSKRVRQRQQRMRQPARRTKLRRAHTARQAVLPSAHLVLPVQAVLPAHLPSSELVTTSLPFLLLSLPSHPVLLPAQAAVTGTPRCRPPSFLPSAAHQAAVLLPLAAHRWVADLHHLEAATNTARDQGVTCRLAATGLACVADLEADLVLVLVLIEDHQGWDPASSTMA